MQERRFLCLAVSRRESGNCIAGIDIDSGEWLRPVRSDDRAAFADSDLIVEDNHTHQSRFMAPLDLLSMPLEQYAGTNSQPENWVVAPVFFEKAPAILRRCTGVRTAQFLLAHADHGELLLHSSRDSLQMDEFADRKLSHSLSLVHPVDLAWSVSPHANHPGKLQVRAEFRFGKVTYGLVVTDPAWEAKCHQLGIGTHKHAVLASPECDLVFLTVSLAAVPFHGLHYKLVAGVIELRALASPA
ncbi:MAG TPA: hypothetical protein VG267_13280 [Terracidiphilus sp.]|jgi:hypothetical protein|nr:hypothetical protein [Terracidiphilus sp.]